MGANRRIRLNGLCSAVMWAVATIIIANCLFSSPAFWQFISCQYRWLAADSVKLVEIQGEPTDQSGSLSAWQAERGNCPTRATVTSYEDVARVGRVREDATRKLLPWKTPKKWYTPIPARSRSPITIGWSDVE